MSKEDTPKIYGAYAKIIRSCERMMKQLKREEEKDRAETNLYGN